MPSSLQVTPVILGRRRATQLGTSHARMRRGRARAKRLNAGRYRPTGCRHPREGKRRVGVLGTARTAFGSGFARSVFWIALGILGLPLAMPRWVLFHDYQLPAHRRDNQPAR